MEEEIRRYHKLVAVAIFVSLMSACGGKWKDMAWGYRALHWTQVAGEATDKSVAAWVNLKNAECAAIIPADADICPECGADFTEDEEGLDEEDFGEGDFGEGPEGELGEEPPEEEPPEEEEPPKEEE